MKYIFVTGGVVSGLGKGICAASLGRLLKQCGLRVKNQKFDPYFNVDPGTMSPYQHGEVFVTDDGAETDLDLGHYERFVDESLSGNASVSSGKVFWSVLNRERQGGYLGGTVQIIPHVTDEIKSRVYAMDDGQTDVVITEIGGTVGDIESQPFLEAIRQVAAEQGRENVLYIHVPLIVAMMGRSHILLQHMHESIRKSAGYLTLRQRIERLGIEDREDRIIAVESIFFLGLVARNDRPGVHLGTRGRHGEDRSQRHGLAGLPLEHDVPCIAVVEKARSDEFRTVDDRPAADSQQEVHLPLFAQRNGFAQGLDRRIRLDAPELDQVAAFECGDDLIVDAVTLDASAAEGQHDAFSGGNELRQTGDLALAENQFGRIVIDEVVHGEYLFILLRRE